MGRKSKERRTRSIINQSPPVRGCMISVRRSSFSAENKRTAAVSEKTDENLGSKKKEMETGYT